MRRSLVLQGRVLFRRGLATAASPASTSPSSSAQQWDICVGVLVNRLPIIAPPMSEVEQRYRRALLAEEVERSKLNDFELKSLQDEKLLLRRAELEAQGKDLSELEGELSLTNAMRIDDWNKQSQTLRERLKMDDRTAFEEDSLKSIRRRLDRVLTLVVKQRFGRKDYTTPWIMPQFHNQENETLRQTAERGIKSLLPGLGDVKVLGNAPYAHFTHIYPKGLGSKKSGSKIFFYQAVVPPRETTQTEDANEVADFQWLTAEEVKTTISTRAYRKAATRVLLE